jgi:FkbM family methyltransferase
MKTILRSTLASWVASAILRYEERRALQLLRWLPSAVRPILQGGMSRALFAEPLWVQTPRGSLAFVVLGETAAVRARGLLTKQPATIDWIDRFDRDSVFWDVGANVGVYTLYAALRDDLRIVAFEPAAVNYFLLAANCELNSVDRRVNCLQVGLGRDKSIGRMALSQFEPGLSFSFRDKRRRPLNGQQAALILSIDQLIDEYDVPCPNYIKIDVPAMTGAIIDGATRTLQRSELRELHIEASEQSTGGRRLVERLTEAGFTIAARHVHGETTDLTFTRHV